jgi:membrane protease YdiL (CAAX protease family)
MEEEAEYIDGLQPYEDDDVQRYKWLRILAIFYGIDIVVCTSVNFLDYFRGLDWLFITEAVLGMLTMIFVVLLWKDLKSLFSWKSYTFPKALVYAVTAVLFAMVVNIGIKWVNITIFHQDVHYYRSFRHLPYPRLGMIMLVAILPAIFEELAYRGIILESLFKISEERQAIFISAFLFAIIHMSFISFFWLVPFAIWLGNIRLKEKTIWYGVLIHFCFNITACFFEFYELKLF